MEGKSKFKESKSVRGCQTEREKEKEREKEREIERGREIEGERDQSLMTHGRIVGALKLTLLSSYDESTCTLSHSRKLSP